MYSLIVAPIDLNAPEVSKRILARALFYLTNSQCEVHLLSIAAASATESMLDEVRSNLMDFAEHHVSAHEGRIHLEVTQGQPSDGILEFSKTKKADCIIIGAHRGGSQLGLTSLGSTAAKVASQASADVCIVKRQ